MFSEADRIVLKCCDCLEGLKMIEPDSVDCVVTSPPYNKGTQSQKTGNQIWKGFKIAYDEYHDAMSEDDYAAWMVDVLNELHRVIKPNGSVFFNHKVILRDCRGHFPKWIFDSKFALYQMIVWDRQCASNMRKETLYPTHELIFWLVKGKPIVFKEQAKFKNDIWPIIPDRNNKHPAPFPYALAENCINLVCKKGSDSLVVDPFTGSGTVALAAKSSGFRFVGFELSQNYVDMANDRLNYVEKSGECTQCNLI